MQDLDRKKVKILKINVLERMGMLLIYIGISAVLDIVFFNNPIFVGVFVPLYFPYRKVVSSELILRKKRELREEYRDAIITMINAMESGYSLEGSIKKAYDVVGIMHGEKSIMAKELIRMDGRVKIGITVEEVFAEFALRSGLKEAAILSGAISITKRHGDNVVELMKMVADLIGNEIKTEKEISVLIASKRYEHLIMCVVPVAMIMYMRITSFDIIKNLYQGYFGRIFMFICMVVYFIAIYIGIHMLRQAKAE